ncbi:AF4/FMR2 family member 4-like isoform X2 [Gigantopelta aegis]|uniref:AF4/FMR2 family member 4-like isoform X2 n=1 Tax=Gigantopelta aegis TaxID=1735272 RepID=UPI001B88CF4F|nr:AF4/FMR2 family member 4-like isoform X2 [Gigantopelta aegis]
MSDQQSDTLNLKARLKEEAQRQRAIQAKRPELTQEKPSVGLFDEPKKIQNSKDDQTYNEIVRVLGRFDNIQPFVQTLNQTQTQQPVVGVVEQPQTPQITGKTFKYSKAEVPNGAVQNAQLKKSSVERPGHDKKYSGVKSKAEPGQDESKTKSELTVGEIRSGHKSKGSNESKAGRDAKVSINIGYKGRVESAREERAISVSPVKSTSHVVSKDLHSKQDSQTPSPGVKSRPPAKPPATPPLKEITPSITSQVESPIHKASSRPHSSTPLKETPPPNGVVKRLGKDETKSRLPKLTIPLENKDLGQGGKDLDDIFKEMIHIQPPLTGINTPHTKVEETFPFPAKYQNKDGKVNNNNHSKEKGTQEDSEKTRPSIRNSLSRDLVISSDESEPEQPPPECQSSRKSPMNAVGKRRISMSSNSDGSSNSSDSSSASDSDLSSSEDDEGKDDKPSPSASQTLPKSPAKESQNWGLRTFIDAVKQSSPEAPIPLEPKHSAPKKIDKTNENLLEELITTGISPHITLKDIGPTVSLPFNTDHLDGKEHSDNIFDMQFAKDMERSQNGVESMDESSCLNADCNSSSRNSLGSPGALSSSSNVSSRHSGKSGKPNSKAHRRQSSAAEKVNKSSKSDGVKNSLNVSKSSANLSRERTTPTKHLKNRNVMTSAEKKQKWNNVKSKAWISDSDSESDFVDVETVTPDGKSTGLLCDSMIDAKKALVLKKLFMSSKDDDSSSSSQGSVPSSTPYLGEKVNASERVCVDNKQKGHRKSERDKEVKSRTENGCHSDKHIDDIIQSLQTTKEFKPPVLLSPIPPFSSPSLEPCDHLSSSHVPGVTSCSDGTPSIIVQISLLLLDCIPAKDYSQSASGVVSQSSDMSAHSKVLTDTELVTDAKSLPSSHTKDSLSLNSKSSDVAYSQKSLKQQNDAEDHYSEKVKSHSDVSDVVLSEKLKVKTSSSPDKLKSKTKVNESNLSNKVKSGSKLNNSDSVEKGKLKSDLTRDSIEKNRSKLNSKENESLEEKKTNTKVSESRTPGKSESVIKVDDNVSQVKSITKLSSSESPEKVKLTTKVAENELPSEVKSNNKVFSSDSENKTKHRSKSSSESVLSEKKSQKRKSDLDRTESNKRHKGSSKSNKRPPSEENERIENGISVKEDEEKTNFLSKRRGSTSSISSQHSNSKKAKFDAKVKKESPSPLRSTQEKETVVPHSQQNGDSHLPFNSYSEEHNHIELKKESAIDGCRSPISRHPLENNLESADIHMAKAKELKHQADKERPVKICRYIESVLQFIQCGCAMERDQPSEPHKIFKMYHETLQLLKYICQSKGSHDSDMPVKDKKLSVLILRIQSLLCLKLFNLRRGEAVKFKKIIDHDHSKSATPKAPAHAPSPHQGGWNSRNTGTPSPMSPTPSPAGSIGSVGSQGSCDLSSSKLTNGSQSSNAMTSPGMVMVSQRIHSVTQQYINISNFAVQCHELWAQAEALARESQEFFAELDRVCRPLTLHSSVLEFVYYVQQGLHRLQDT